MLLGRTVDRLSSEIRRHVWEIRSGGLRVLFSKAGFFITRVGPRVLLRIPALVILGVVRLLRPVVCVRFGPLISTRLGHFAANTELYLCQRDMRDDVPMLFDVFYHNGPVCNSQMKRMWDRELCVHWFAKHLDWLNKRIPGGDAHAIPKSSALDPDGLLAKLPTHLHFTPDEECRGREALLGLGIPEGAQFVCFHARDSAYLGATQPHTDWRYHDYRDSDIANYLPAAMALTDRGYWAIRMGAVVDRPLCSEAPMIVDYASECRTDFMDVYLASHCAFYFGSASGLAEVPRVLRRPIVYVNVVPIMHAVSPGMASSSLFVPKRLWLREEQRYMTFRETCEAGLGDSLATKAFDAVGVEVVENNTQEIADVVLEMEDRLSETWEPDNEDEELQQSFWSSVGSPALYGETTVRIGAAFLRNNSSLLD